MASHFNQTERLIARFLSSFPGLKLWAKRKYQFLNYVLYRKDYRVKTVRKLYSLPFEEESFFGYYDHSPESSDQRYILFHQTTSQSTKSLPSAKVPIEVCVFDQSSNCVKFKKETFSYNWQQGARAQWLAEDLFIFNSYENESAYQAVKVKLTDGVHEITQLPLPIYDCFKDEYALTLNFERLQLFRPDYGYRNCFNSELPEDSKDGIIYMDLKSGKSNLIISLSRLKHLEPNKYFSESSHKVNHIMISPDGEKFIFLHRYIYKGQRFDRLILSDKEGNALQVLSDDDMVSHCCWKGNSQVIGYLRDFDKGDGYFLIDLNVKSKVKLNQDEFAGLGDGHPSINETKMIFDTYPDKSRMKSLYFFDLASQHKTLLGQFFESLTFSGETRCDLHPRFNEAGSKVYFDSVHEGRRRLYWIDLNEK